ncbi:Protein of unknown function [Lachnospiraceae bacterium YSD2013]|nr:Protein of unknown function [Lachnospiraceae bacterium YSD2013]
MKVEDEAARQFYLEEAAKCGWSSRQLDRQINSFFYQRILASKDKDSVASEIDTLDNHLASKKSIKKIEKEQMERLHRKAKAGKLMLDE